MQRLILLALCLAAGLLTAGANVPNADDAAYVNSAVAGTRATDTLHKGGLPPVIQALHGLQVYEPAVGALARMTGISVHTWYWALLPPFWATLTVLSHWWAFRYFLIPRDALSATAVLVLLLATWGGSPQAYGNFGFVRLFQGKAIYLCVVLPQLPLAAFKYRDAPSVPSWLLLMGLQLTALGLTVNALVVAPIAVGLALVASSSRIRPFVLGLASSLPLLAVGGWWYATWLAPYRSALGGDPVWWNPARVLGDWRTLLVIGALVVLPWLVRGRSSGRRLAWYVGLTMTLIVLPPVRMLATTVFGDVYSWRLFWAVPIPLLVSMAAALALASHWRRAAIGSLLAFACAGPIPVSSWSVAHIGQPKVDRTIYAAAERIARTARKDRPALVAEPVATYLATFPNAPPMIGVRRLYLLKLRGLVPDSEIEARVLLMDACDGQEVSADVERLVEVFEIVTIACPESRLWPLETTEGGAIPPFRP